MISFLFALVSSVSAMSPNGYIMCQQRWADNVIKPSPTKTHLPNSADIWSMFEALAPGAALSAHLPIIIKAEGDHTFAVQYKDFEMNDLTYLTLNHTSGRTGTIVLRKPENGQEGLFLASDALITMTSSAIEQDNIMLDSPLFVKAAANTFRFVKPLAPVPINVIVGRMDLQSPVTQPVYFSEKTNSSYDSFLGDTTTESTGYNGDSRTLFNTPVDSTANTPVFDRSSSWLSFESLSGKYNPESVLQSGGLTLQHPSSLKPSETEEDERGIDSVMLSLLAL